VKRLPLYYSDTFTFPLPDGHRFPLEKYRALRRLIQGSELAGQVELRIPAPATISQLKRAHSTAYIEKVFEGTLTAAHSALRAGIAMNLAGGTHHAHRDFGSGFCIFNDVAVAVRELQCEAGRPPVLIIDCDVHQGDGTASIFEDDPLVFTFSIHAERNFPFRKAASDLDLPLPDGCGDEAYLAALNAVLPALLDQVNPSIVFYIAGADPYRGDTLGRLALTRVGLAERDRLVMATCMGRSIPLAVVLGGGYAMPIADTVEIHLETVRLAVESQFENQPGQPPAASGLG
jgi:acetoin utilization deacetylase AcuC-like enzyme